MIEIDTNQPAELIKSARPNGLRSHTFHLRPDQEAWRVANAPETQLHGARKRFSPTMLLCGLPADRDIESATSILGWQCCITCKFRAAVFFGVTKI